MIQYFAAIYHLLKVNVSKYTGIRKQTILKISFTKQLTESSRIR